MATLLQSNQSLKGARVTQTNPHLSGLLRITHTQGESFQRFVLPVEEPRTKVGGSSAIDDGTAHDVRPLFEREAF